MNDKASGSASHRGTTSDPASRDHDLWLEQIIPFVEAAIDELVRSYVENPFIHRVEHSLHAQLYGLLTAHPVLNRLYPMGNTGFKTGLVHKEWPETIARASKATLTRPARRGNFDLALLSPHQLAGVTSIEQFARGELPAPIVIELGLGYGAGHLEGDIEKLLGSKVPHPFLVHFSHVRSRKHPLTEARVKSVPPPLQIAYVRHDLDSRTVHVKGRLDTSITELPYEAANS